MAGRPKGSGNKNTTAIKDMLRAALERSGGTEYFVEQAKSNPSSFMSLISKTIPADVSVIMKHTFFDQQVEDDA
jgi:hypothetical protein